MTETAKPLLIGMNNPYGPDPRHALFPVPEKSAGGRLFRMFQEASARRFPNGPAPYRQTYINGFDRHNVLGQQDWDKAAARAAGAQLLPTLAGRCAVVLGRDTCTALGLDRKAPWLERRELVLQPTTGAKLVWWLVPHPSGMCREYNDPTMRQRVGDLMLDLFLGATQ